MGLQDEQNKVLLPPRRSSEWFAALHFPRPFGMASANLWQKTVFSWGAPLLDKGEQAQITEEMADCLPPPEDEAPIRTQQFAACYDSCQVCLLPGIQCTYAQPSTDSNSHVADCSQPVWLASSGF